MFCIIRQHCIIPSTFLLFFKLEFCTSSWLCLQPLGKTCKRKNLADHRSFLEREAFWLTVQKRQRMHILSDGEILIQQGKYHPGRVATYSLGKNSQPMQSKRQTSVKCFRDAEKMSLIIWLRVERHTQARGTTWITICWKVIMAFLPNNGKLVPLQTIDTDKVEVN